MKILKVVGFLTIYWASHAYANQTPDIYLNQSLGFNIKGFNYQQSDFPCEIDKTLVLTLISQSKKEGIRMEPTASPDKISNGVIPVLAIDIEELVLNEKFRFGSNAKSNLPRVGVTAAIIKGEKGKDTITAKHTCAIASLNKFTPSSNILDMGTTTTVCKATQKCLRELSKDIVQWVEQAK
jgi:hypothetical protein